MAKENKLQAGATEKISEQDYEVNQLLKHLAPWREKGMSKEEMGDWQTTLTTTMMEKILNLWLTKENQAFVEKAMQFYHPLDRAALVYALLVYVLASKKMDFKSAVVQHQYNVIREAMREGRKNMHLDDRVTFLKENVLRDIQNEWNGVLCYEDAVYAIAQEVNSCFRFTTDMMLLDRLTRLLALAWSYAEKEFGGKSRLVDNYEGFIECLRTDVYMVLYRRINGFYGFLEPERERK